MVPWRGRSQREVAREIPADRLATLLKVSAALTSSLELTEVMQTAIEATVEVLRLETGAIYLLDDEALFLGATTPPIPPDFPEEYRHAPLRDHPHIERAIATGDPIHLSDTRTADVTAAERAVMEARSLRSLLYIPLVLEERGVGILIVGTQTGIREFNDEDVALCRTLSAQVSLAVANARLFDSVVKTNREIARVNANLERIVEERTEDLAGANEELRSQADELLAQTIELQQLTEELTESNEARSKFLRSVSHELRTPLNAIMGFSDLMVRGLSGDLDSEQLRQAEMIHAAGSHLLELINDILDLSRIDAGELRLTSSKLRPGEFVAECVEAVMPEADAKSLALTADVPEDVPALTTDKTRVRQILLNLLGNAVKYTDSGSVQLLVTCPDDRSVRFSVIDTGPGIEPEEQEEIFLEFVRGAAGRNSTAEGTGLGLSISRRMAEALGGTLTLTSVPGEGSTFTLTLPVSV